MAEYLQSEGSEDTTRLEDAIGRREQICRGGIFGRIQVHVFDERWLSKSSLKAQK